jgi:hypothetical protein
MVWDSGFREARRDIHTNTGKGGKTRYTHHIHTDLGRQDAIYTPTPARTQTHVDAGKLHQSETCVGLPAVVVEERLTTYRHWFQPDHLCQTL